MENAKRTVVIGGLALAGLGVLSLGLSVATQGRLNLSLPLIFLVLGGLADGLAAAYSHSWRWAALLYIPGAMVVALGLIFLLDVITGDWNSWAYAWLLLLTGAGIGTLQANRDSRWPSVVSQAAMGAAVLGLILFALFGAIAGGLFIQVMAAVMLVAGGISLRWVGPERVLPTPLLKRLRPAGSPPVENTLSTPDQALLIEPLSPRELEVLRLIDQGLSNPEIAGRLTLAPSTVKTHINNIYGKLGVQGRVQALNRARDLSLIE
jgi:DNA-binding CsgD family transcriptional regulator